MRRAVSAVVRERARERMLSRSSEERLASIRRMQEGRARKRALRPTRLAEVESRRAALGAEYQELPSYPAGRDRRREIRKELEDLDRERLTLRYPTERSSYA